MITKAQYRSMLRTKAWRVKRLEILTRDKFKCRNCKSDKRLTVHHLYYIDGFKPWEYSNPSMITLCDKCHRKLHKDQPISSFIRKKITRKVRSTKRKS